jgi:hypothetical protein
MTGQPVPERREAFGPRVVDAASALANPGDQSGPLELFYVLHHRDARHRQLLRQHSRARRPAHQALEDHDPQWMTEQGEEPKRLTELLRMRM